MSRLIQVGNLPDSIDNSILQQLFEAHGPVRSTVINRRLETEWSAGIGFVEMASDEAGDAAIAALDQRDHCGHILSVCWRDSEQHQGPRQHRLFGPMNTTSDAVSGKGIDQP